jgi:hypothetical protein
LRASAVTPPRTTLRRAAGRRRQNDVRVDRNLSRSFRRYAQKRGAHPSSRPRRESPAGSSIGKRDAPPEARAGGLPACQPRLQSPGSLRSAALTHPAAPGVKARRACLSANGMRPLKPAQAGFLPASRDFSRQAVSEAQRSPIQPPQAWKPGGLVDRQTGCTPGSPRRRASCLPAATSVARQSQKRSVHPSSRPRRGSPAGSSIGKRDAPPEARAGGLPACQPRLQSPGSLRSAALTHPAAPGVKARRARLSANGMHPLKPAQAGFLPASRDFSRQAVSEAQRSPIQPPQA